jgi:hypothetical protein
MMTKDQIVDRMVHWVGSKVVSLILENYEWNQKTQQWELIDNLDIRADEAEYYAQFG